MHRAHPMLAAGSLAALVLLLAASPAQAQNASDKATAEVLFNQGKALLGDGKFGEACPKLAESLRLDTGIGTMLYLAECYERSGKTASAWAQFREAQATASKDNDARARIAKERADQLEPKLSRLAVVVPAASEVDGLVVTRDGTPIGRAGWGVDAPIDPGPHVIRAEAPGREPRVATIDVAANGESARFLVPALALAATTPGSPRPPVDVAPAPSSGSTQRTLGIGIAAAGLVALGFGSFFGLRAISTLDDSKPHCTDRTCDAAGLDLRDRSLTQANVSTVLFVVSGLALAGGAVLWLTAPHRSSASAGPLRVAVVPMLAPSTAAVSAAFRF